MRKLLPAFTALLLQTADGFIGCVFGLYATSSGQPTTNTASFKWLKYEGNDPMYKKTAVN